MKLLKFATTHSNRHLLDTSQNTQRASGTPFQQFALTSKAPPAPPTHTGRWCSFYNIKGYDMTKKIKILVAVALVTVFLPTNNARAQIPVIDPASIAQVVIQIEKMTQDYLNQIEQLDQALSTYNSLTGGRNIGDLLNSAPVQDLRRALPADLQDMIGLNSASGLGAAGLQTQNIYNDLLTTYNPISGADLFPSDPSGTLALAHDRNAQTTTAALAASQSSYNNATARMEGYESLLGELNTSPDLKSSVDLLARISTENGLLMNEIMKLQAMQIQLNAAKQGELVTNARRINDARTYDDTTAAQAFQPPSP